MAVLCIPRCSGCRAADVTGTAIAPVTLAPAHSPIRHPGVPAAPPPTFLLRSDRESANEIQHLAFEIRQKLPLFLAVQDDVRALDEPAVRLMRHVAFDVRGATHLS